MTKPDWSDGPEPFRQCPTGHNRCAEVLVSDVIGGDIGKRSAGVSRAGGTLVTIAGPTEARPADGLAIDFVLVSDRAQLGEIVQRVRDGRLRTNIGTSRPSTMPSPLSIRPS